MFKKLFAAGGAAALARNFVQKNPDKARKYAGQAASFVDKQTKGKYRKQIDGAVRQVDKQIARNGRQYPNH